MNDIISAFPLVSICIPVYNGALYLSESLDSAIAQTYRPLEIVITDDASTDDSLKIVEEYRQKTNLPFNIYNHQPAGIGANWNFALERAEGEYIKFLFQDDILDAECITKMMMLALQDEAIGLVYSDRNFIIEENIASSEDLARWIDKYSSLYKNWSTPVKKIQLGADYLKDPLLVDSPYNKIGEPTCVLLKKSTVIEAGLFNTTLRQSLDYEAWYRIFKYCKVGFIPEKLCSFRVHNNQESIVNRRRKLAERKLYKREIWRNLLPYLNPAVKKNLQKEFGFSFKKLIKRAITLFKRVIS